MFFGTTPAPVRDYIAREIREVQPARVFEPCAGNFVISMVCGAIDKNITVFSGDVSLYSVGIGHGLAGKDSGIRLKPELEHEYPNFAGRRSPEEVAALLIVFAELATCRSKRHIRYYASLERDLRDNADAYLGAILGKIRSARELLGDFRFAGQDASLTLSSAADGDMVFYDPPYYLGDYEKESKLLAECFDAPEIEYEELCDDAKLKTLSDLTDRGCLTFFRQEEPTDIDGYQRVFQYEYKAGGKCYHVYCNRDAIAAHGRAVVMPERQAPYDVIFELDVLGPDEEAVMVPLDSRVANHYRLMWTRKAQMRDTGRPWGVIVGGKIVGIVSVMSAEQFGHEYACVVADAAPLYTRHKRLGKLVLHGLLSEEFLRMVNETFMYDHTGFTTVAYTNSPVSMKYRGLFDLVERKEGSPSGHTYTLVYRTTKIRHQTVQDAYDAWLKKDGKKLK